jgi:hypothetical protein
MQLSAIQNQYRDALKASLKIQEASQHAMLQRFEQMDLGVSQGPTRAEELAAGLKELLLDDDSDDHKLLVQVIGTVVCTFFLLHCSDPSLAVSESHQPKSWS